MPAQGDYKPTKIHVVVKRRHTRSGFSYRWAACGRYGLDVVGAQHWPQYDTCKQCERALARSLDTFARAVEVR
jgi:hypothetical protein